MLTGDSERLCTGLLKRRVVGPVMLWKHRAANHIEDPEPNPDKDPLGTSLLSMN